LAQGEIRFSLQILTACPPNISFPPPDVSLEYELVTFMAVFLGGLHDVYIRHFPDPLLS
jgi:hypothetical protein